LTDPAPRQRALGPDRSGWTLAAGSKRSHGWGGGAAGKDGAALAPQETPGSNTIWHFKPGPWRCSFFAGLGLTFTPLRPDHAWPILSSMGGGSQGFDRPRALALRAAMKLCHGADLCHWWVH